MSMMTEEYRQEVEERRLAEMRSEAELARLVSEARNQGRQANVRQRVGCLLIAAGEALAQ